MESQVKEMIVSGLRRNGELLKLTLADFSEADMLVRPVPAANHAAWMVGHLAAAEAAMVNACAPGAIPALPDGFGERFTGKTTSVDDPARLAGKEELLATFDRVRSATIAWASTLVAADLTKPGPERVRAIAPTVGALLNLLTTHVALHTGQIQVIRRKLGKPVLF